MSIRTISIRAVRGIDFSDHLPRSIAVIVDDRGAGREITDRLPKEREYADQEKRDIGLAAEE